MASALDRLRRCITLWLCTLALPALAANPFQEPLVTITLDDGWSTQYTQARAALNARGIKATYCLITDAVAQGWGGYMTLAQVQTLMADGNEMASHTRTHPDLTTLSPTQLASELQGSQAWMVNTLGLASVPDFCSPYGLYNPTVLAAIQQSYASHRTVTGGRNFRDTVVYELRGNDVHSGVSVATVRGWVDQAILEKSWLVLVFHEFTTGTPVRDTQYRTSNFKSILDHVRTRGVRTVTLAEGLALTEGRTQPDLSQGTAVYTDGLENGFADWSWAEHGLDETGVVHTGASAIRFEPDAWSGLMFHHPGLDLSLYQSLDVWVHGGTTGGQAVRVVLHDGSQTLGSERLDTVLGAPIAAGTWQKVSIPLSSIGATSGTLQDLYFQDDSGGDQPTLYLDDVVLVPH